MQPTKHHGVNDVVVETPPAAYGAPERPAASRGDLRGDLLGY